jgi:methyl-accepting chemotaxis protein
VLINMEQNNESNLLINNLLDAIATPVIQISKDFIIQRINSAALQILDISYEQAIGKKCHDLFNTEDCGGGQCATLRSMKEKRKIESETVAHIKGKNIPIKYYASPLYDESGGVIGAVEYILDLTDQKTAIQDILDLTKAAIDGDLEKRADVTRYQGDFRKIVEGINTTLDSIIIPVNEALRVSKEYAQSNFATRIDPSLSVNGDWIEFKNSLNNIGIQVSEAIQLINKKLKDLSSDAEGAAASIEEVSAGAQQIAQNTGEVSVNSVKGEEGISQILKAMEDLTITVSEVSRRAEDVSNSALKADEFAKKGVELAKQSDITMNEIKTSSLEAESIVKEINQQMDEIGKIVRLISDIANQTNLLALNAAIEAARAGDAGRGFAVVATEVKSLAQDSRKSAENITEMITTLQSKARKANDAMIHTGKTVETGSESLSKTIGAFDQIAGSIEEITRTATDVASSSEEQAASVEEVTASINEVSILVQNTAKEAGDAAAATEEASASIEQISKIVNNVNQVVDVISGEMSKFKI